MIGSFKDRRLKRLYEAGDRSKLAPEHGREDREHSGLAGSGRRRMEEMNLPRFRLHPLKGDRKGFWSITVRANWRIVFRFEDGKAFDVELIDYH